MTAEWLRVATGNPATVSDVARYWDEQASSFDEAPDHGLRDPPIRAAWASLLAPLIPPAPARVADVGCGTGSLAVLLAESGHVVSGIDVEPDSPPTSCWRSYEHTGAPRRSRRCPTPSCGAAR